MQESKTYDNAQTAESEPVAEKIPDAMTDKEEEKKKELEKKENRLEIVVAIFLGLTALLVAWATWIGSVHGGNMSSNYTESNNYSSEATAEYDAALILVTRDMDIWNVLQDYLFEKGLAEFRNEADVAQMIQGKVDRLLENCTEELREAFQWAYEQDATGAVSPFSKEGMLDSYFTVAKELMEESQTYMEDGKTDGLNCDKYGLVAVLYAFVLFLLGIVGIFRRLPNRRLVFWIAIVLLVLGTIFMCTIPLPTDFDFLSYFQS